MDVKSAKNLRFFIPYLDLIKKCKVILAFLQILKPIVPETAQKIKKNLFAIVSLNSIFHPSFGLSFLFS